MRVFTKLRGMAETVIGANRAESGREETVGEQLRGDKESERA